MQDVITWVEKADALLSFWTVAHNATWNSSNGLISGGQMIGGAILLTFVNECALKALLEKEGKEITGSLKIHDVYTLFKELEPKTRTDASAIYAKLIQAEKDVRVHRKPVNDLACCLQNHARTFTNWRYEIVNAGKFYHMPMIYAASSFLTLANPTRTYSVRSATSPVTEILAGKIIRK